MTIVHEIDAMTACFSPLLIDDGAVDELAWT